MTLPLDECQVPLKKCVEIGGLNYFKTRTRIITSTGKVPVYIFKKTVTWLVGVNIRTVKNYYAWNMPFALSLKPLFLLSLRERLYKCPNVRPLTFFFAFILQVPLVGKQFATANSIFFIYPHTPKYTPNEPITINNLCSFQDGLSENLKQPRGGEGGRLSDHLFCVSMGS